MTRRRCADMDETKAHDRHFGARGSFVGDSPRATRYRKRKTNRRERREGRDMIRRYR